MSTCSSACETSTRGCPAAPCAPQVLCVQGLTLSCLIFGARLVDSPLSSERGLECVALSSCSSHSLSGVGYMNHVSEHMGTSCIARCLSISARVLNMSRLSFSVYEWVSGLILWVSMLCLSPPYNRMLVEQARLSPVCLPYMSSLMGGAVVLDGPLRPPWHCLLLVLFCLHFRTCCHSRFHIILG